MFMYGPRLAGAFGTPRQGWGGYSNVFKVIIRILDRDLDKLSVPSGLEVPAITAYPLG
jgi:hypothetical protein